MGRQTDHDARNATRCLTQKIFQPTRLLHADSHSCRQNQELRFVSLPPPTSHDAQTHVCTRNRLEQILTQKRTNHFSVSVLLQVKWLRWQNQQDGVEYRNTKWWFLYGISFAADIRRQLTLSQPISGKWISYLAYYVRLRLQSYILLSVWYSFVRFTHLILRCVLWRSHTVEVLQENYSNK